MAADDEPRALLALLALAALLYLAAWLAEGGRETAPETPAAEPALVEGGAS
jgi:hypothetical protein